MLRQHKVSFTPTLRVFISKVITPLVLVGGLVVLVLFNFRMALSTATSADNHFRGNVAFSQGPLAYNFKQTNGIDRPQVRYNNQELLTYAEWSSTLSVDGLVSQLWNNDHGYSIDESRRQAFSTVIGDGWQLNEVVTLVDNHTVVVTYNLTAQPQNNPPPANYVLDIVHTHSTWFSYQTSSNTFAALVTSSKSVTSRPSSIGAVTIKVAGGAPTVHHSLKVDNTKSFTDTKGTVKLANTLITEYVVRNPVPRQMITLGTETISFQPKATSVGAPLD
ncbi:MAG: hypothetical protein J2P37_03265 [Ktedonobacteraceae bacterium]|nr:hypothetical protein [Ktedonobacteraceae bacterium]